MSRFSDLFSEKTVKEEVFVESKVVEEVSAPKVAKELVSPKEVKESTDVFPPSGKKLI
jgi:hypothetical protein